MEGLWKHFIQTRNTEFSVLNNRNVYKAGFQWVAGAGIGSIMSPDQTDDICQNLVNTRKPLDSVAVTWMVVLCAIWGLQQVVLKAMAADIAPVMHIGLRSALAAVLVAGLMRWRGERMDLRDGTLRAGLVVGILFALEFVLVAEGLRHTNASHMVVFLYTAPVFAALGLHVRLPSERLGARQWAGIGLAFGGLAWSFLGAGFGAAGEVMPQRAVAMLWGDMLGLLAGLSWGATTVVVRCSRLAHAPATQTLQYQLIGASGVLLLVAMASDQAGVNFTLQVWVSLAFQVVIVSFASFLAWFWLLRTYVASRLGVFSFMTPLFGMAFGVLLLNEPLEARFLLGALPVLLGVALVNAG
jgi:drug/metabolite transporter (DMT)-like permease